MIFTSQKAEELYWELDKQNNIRARYYLRHSGVMTIAVSVSKATGEKAMVGDKIHRTGGFVSG